MTPMIKPMGSHVVCCEKFPTNSCSNQLHANEQQTHRPASASAQSDPVPLLAQNFNILASIGSTAERVEPYNVANCKTGFSSMRPT